MVIHWSPRRNRKSAAREGMGGMGAWYGFENNQLSGVVWCRWLSTSGGWFQRLKNSGIISTGYWRGFTFFAAFRSPRLMANGEGGGLKSLMCAKAWSQRQLVSRYRRRRSPASKALLRFRSQQWPRRLPSPRNTRLYEIIIPMRFLAIADAPARVASSLSMPWVTSA